MSTDNQATGFEDAESYANDAEPETINPPVEGGGEDGGMSRRERARARDAAQAEEIVAYKAKIAELERQHAETRNVSLHASQELARLRGFVEAQQQRASAPPAPPDPAQLRKEARKALESGNVDEYEEKLAAAVKADVLKDLPQPQQQQQAAPQVSADPVFQAAFGAHIAKHPELAALPRHELLARLDAFDRIAALGNPDPVARMSDVFAQAVASLGGKTAPSRPQFPRSNRGLLQGGAHGSDSGADDPNAANRPSEADLKRMGMTAKEWDVYSQPGSESRGVKW